MIVTNKWNEHTLWNIKDWSFIFDLRNFCLPRYITGDFLPVLFCCVRLRLADGRIFLFMRASVIRRSLS